MTVPSDESRVTEDDALDVARTRVCDDCRVRVGEEHLEQCPQRNEPEEPDDENEARTAVRGGGSAGADPWDWPGTPG